MRGRKRSVRAPDDGGDRPPDPLPRFAEVVRTVSSAQASDQHFNDVETQPFTTRAPAIWIVGVSAKPDGLGAVSEVSTSGEAAR